MKVIFLGTPDFSVPTLKAIIKSHHQLLAVVTQPDKPSGRGERLSYSPVKQVALENNLKVLQYDKIRLQGVDDLKRLAPDIMVTCAFGQILSQEIIDIAPHGIINVHASLLPKYRGAAPIQWSILNGDKETGVTIMQTEAGIDTGDIIAVEKTIISPEETAGELFDRLSFIGAELLVRTLDDIEQGTATFTPQDHSSATHVKMLKKSDGMLDFKNNCETLVNFVRGMNPWPCAFTFLNDKMLKVYKAEKVEDVDDSQYADGQIMFADSKNGLVVKCKNGALRLCVIQIEGKKRMKDTDFVIGQRINLAEKIILGEHDQ